MAQFELARRRRDLSAFLWPTRLVLLIGVFELTFNLLYKHLPFFVGVPLGGIVAAGALALEVLITARVRQQPWGRIAVWRMLMFDHLASKRGQAYVNQARETEPAMGPAGAASEFGELTGGETTTSMDPHESATGKGDFIDGSAVELDD